MKVIGFSGKKQHGKDTAANMWRYFCYNSGQQCSFEDYLSNKYWDEISIGTLKFADKLKDIVCLLTGCTREQLEMEDFKNSTMPICWGKPFSIIHNKDEDIDWEGRNIIPSGKSSEPFRQSSTKSYFIQLMTYREALQLVGTDSLRKHFHDDVWVNATIAEFDNYDVSLVTDVRFPNEVEAIGKYGGTTIRIIRTDMENPDQHASETALDNYSFNHVILCKGGDMEGLFEAIKRLYEML